MWYADYAKCILVHTSTLGLVHTSAGSGARESTGVGASNSLLCSVFCVALLCAALLCVALLCVAVLCVALLCVAGLCVAVLCIGGTSSLRKPRLSIQAYHPLYPISTGYLCINIRRYICICRYLCTNTCTYIKHLHSYTPKLITSIHPDREKKMHFHYCFPYHGKLRPK